MAKDKKAVAAANVEKKADFVKNQKTGGRSTSDGYMPSGTKKAGKK